MLNPFKEGREKELKVGSHVILNHETKPYTWNGSNIHGNSINYAMRDKMIVTELDFHDAVINDGLRIDPVHLIVVSNPDEEGKMSDFKVGDEVVLRPETKPYTFKGSEGNIEELENLEDNEIYKISYIHSDGDVAIVLDGQDYSNISPHHLKYAKEDTNISTLSVDLDLNELIKDIDIVELRLAIFKGNTSRTLEEMQEIEKWLLNK